MGAPAPNWTQIGAPRPIIVLPNSGNTHHSPAPPPHKPHAIQRAVSVSSGQGRRRCRSAGMPLELKNRIRRSPGNGFMAQSALGALVSCLESARSARLIDGLWDRPPDLPIFPGRASARFGIYRKHIAGKGARWVPGLRPGKMNGGRAPNSPIRGTDFLLPGEKVSRSDG